MNCLTKTAGMSSVRQVSKIGLYRLFRCLGTRLYSTEAWIKSSSCCLTSVTNQQFIQTQCISTTAINMGLKEKMKERFTKLVTIDKLKNKHALRLTSIRLYLSCTNALIYNEVHKHVNLPSSFSTWHKLVGLHVWIIMTRLAVEDEPGMKIKKLIVTAFNEDTTQQVSDLGSKLELRVKDNEVNDLYQQFTAALFAYDEGLLNNDRLLAGSLWRTVFSQSNDVNPTDLEVMVQYVRKNIKFIHSLDRNHVLTNGMIPFLPMKGDKVPQESYDFLNKVSQANLDMK